MDKAFDTQHQLLLLNDSIRGTMMAENISQMEHEKQLMTYQQKMSRLMNIILAITIGLAILAIILMTRNILIRRRSRKRLLAKNAELKEANLKVMAADEMKTDFMRSVSHEIRTPLNIINGFSQVLTNEENTFEPEERHQIAETISSSTHQITSLVNKMLALVNQNTKDLLKAAEDTDALDICHKAMLEMPPVDADRIKDEFTAGLGLGLAYCRETAERLGGTLQLDRTSEAGTTFTLGLPLKVNHQK